jgi:TolA-binding protein
MQIQKLPENLRIPVPSKPRFSRGLMAGVVSCTLVFGGVAEAQQRRAAPRRARTGSMTSVNRKDPIQAALNQAIRLARAGQYQAAAASLFTLSRRPELATERMQIRYILGLMLFELKLNQVAAFQFVDVIRDGKNKYDKPSLEKLSVAADRLKDDTLLNYAISKMELADFPESQKDMLLFRMGEVRLKSQNFKEAQELFARVNPQSRYGYEAKYDRGLSLAEMGDTQNAVRIFKDLYDTRSGAFVTDNIRVAAMMALARTYYQKQDWDTALSYYREIPRDHEMWHDALFESSWALLRSARFRSAISNFHSLHSTYYEDFYLPESLLLRAIVYLYICKYDEMEKVLGLFENTYGPTRAKMTDFIQTVKDPIEYYNELERAAQARKDMKLGRASKSGLRLPYIVARKILGSADVQRSLDYLRELAEEQKRLATMPQAWVESPIGKYAVRILNNRMRNSKILIGDIVKAHILQMRAELRDLYEQAGFIRYEMINGRKEQLKKKIAGKGLPDQQIDDDASRDFYIQNGYEYWPFRGEYWLDEIGNYHYVGRQSCE